MKSLRALALFAPLLLVPLACENSSTPSGSVLPEAGPGFEAGPSPEAGPLPDAGDDGPVTPTTKGVTVTVTENGVAKSNVRVLGHDAAGVLNGDKKTDATGKVSFALAPSMVTVLTGDATNAQPITYVGVADGDKLLVGLVNVPFKPNPVPFAKITASFTADPISTKGNSFLVTVGSNCQQTGTLVDVPVSVDLYPECLGAKNAVLAAVFNNGTLTEYGFAKDVAVTMGSNVNVGPLGFLVPGKTTVTASHVPATQGSQLSRLYAIANGFSYGATAASGGLDTGGVTFDTATGFAEAYQSAVSLSVSGATTMTKAFVRREATTAPASATLTDFDFATALPFIQTATIATSTPQRPSVTFTSEAPLTGSDGGFATVFWNSNAGSGTWTFVLPPSATGFTAPALPADASAFAPVGNSFLRDITYVEATLVPGYAELKALPIRPTRGLDITDDPSTPLPVAGTVKVTNYNGLPR